ncbi:MAG: DUF354 domain-containing protein [candidate division Zixibacteria bacterium]|nr:DUF354 domain-containing protein [candidate division Zixibacteria bacterium]
MKIVIDIGHPAHVHFFKHFIWRMQEKGHQFLITAIEKDMTLTLLENYGFPHINLGGYGRSLTRKLVQIPLLDYKLYRIVKGFDPDLFLGLASFRAAHVAFAMRAPCALFDDTEKGRAEVVLYRHFTNYVCTPSCYQGDLGAKQVRYPGYHELAYLHPNRFTPDPSVLNRLGVKQTDPFVVMRFVGWQAVHDIGHTGLSLQTKKQAVEAFSRHAKVFITSESSLPPELEPHRIPLAPEDIHHVLAYARLLYGESATMASECSILGTPAIYLDNDGRGYTDEQEQAYGSVFNFTESTEDQQRSIAKGLEILAVPNVKQIWAEKRARLLNNKIDVTAWMMEFVEKLERR